MLVSTGVSVHCLDNLSTGLEKNIRHLLPSHNLTFERSDVATPKQFSGKYDLILHFASRVSPEDYQQHQIETLAANSLGTQNMLELARRSDAVFVYASSSEVYGDAEVIPTPESYWGRVNPIGPRSCYDEGKRYGEALCTAYKRTYNLDSRIVRIFNTYGPRIRADGTYARAIPRFVIQALKADSMTVFGDGTQTRSFCYITDAAAAIIKVSSSRAAKGEVFNIGNPEEIAIVDVAQKIKQITGSNSQIIHEPLPADDPKRRCPNIEKARRMLCWEPRVSLDEGLTSTVSWFKAELVQRDISQDGRS
jgi:nucleoside-diphosphate-sugar epimerase